MIAKLLQIIPFILAILSMAGLLYAWSNLQPVKRGRQFAMPPAAFVYCIAVICLIDRINAWIISLLDSLSRFQYLAFLTRLREGWKFFIVVNLILIGIYLLVKKILLLIFDKIWSNHRIMDKTSGAFYEYGREFDAWFLKMEYAQMRDYLRLFYFAATGVLLLFTILVNSVSALLVYRKLFYSALGFILLGELVFYFGGITKKEYIENILGEDERSYEVANYSLLLEPLRNIFGDRIMYDRYMDFSDNVTSNFDALMDLVNSDLRSEKNIGDYFERLKSEGEKIDENYIKSCIDLLNGKSVVFHNAFYRDLTHYVTFVMMRNLFSYKKCLVVSGRDQEEQDVKKWLDECFLQATGLPSFFRTEVLTSKECDWDVGIIQFSEIYNLRLLNVHEKELAEVGFVFLVEPSRILATGQLGLNLLLAKCDRKDELVYCACDRNCDGLVDALSHVLKTNITEVTAAQAVTGHATEIYWKADGEYLHHRLVPNISRYLGVGSEIGLVAINNQVPQAMWVGSESFPVRDMKWILGQYYQTLCKYLKIPVSQEALYDRFKFGTSFWGVPASENQFLIVEDEFCNLYDTARMFSTRADDQSVVNVISGNYLWRDYMLDNAGIFENDPKAVPTVVADYARTERNTVLKLMMLMAEQPVSEAYILNELRLTGIYAKDVYEEMRALIAKHCYVDHVSMKVIFKEELEPNQFISITKKFYMIADDGDVAAYVKNLKNAYYLAEDELSENHYIASKLYGHVFQNLLPGQFFSYDGKYYEAVSISYEKGVVVRRAAEHLVERKYYRQLRDIEISGWQDEDVLGARREEDNIEIVRGHCDIRISTYGYMEMPSNENVKDAKFIYVDGIPVREYRNKSILKVHLPNITKEVRYTIALVLNEMFRTIYPDTWQYLYVAVKTDEDFREKSNLKNVVYELKGEVEEDYFYIIEDSEIDLGLIVSFERNIRRYLEFVTEYLTWYTTEIPEEEENAEEEAEEQPSVVEEEEVFQEKTKYTWWQRVKDFFRRHFGKGLVPGGKKPKKKKEKEEGEGIENEKTEE